MQRGARALATWSRRTAVVLLGLLLTGGHARAQGFGDFEYVGRLEDARRQPSPLSAGPHSFEPSIVYKLFGVTTPHVFGAAIGGWTDNYLRGDAEAPGALERASYGRLDVGARLDTEIFDHRIEVGYRALATELVDSGRYDTLEQQATIRADLYWTDLAAHANVEWRRRSFPQSILLRGIVQTETVSGRAWGEARLGRFGVRVGGSALHEDYLDRNLSFLDRRQLGLDLQVYGRIQPKLRLVADYEFDAIRYDERGLNDYHLHQVRGGLDGVLTAKLSASLSLGVGFQDIQHPLAGTDSRSFRGLVAACSVRYQVLPLTSLSVGYTRSLQPSTRSNFLASDDVSATISQSFAAETVHCSADVGYTHAHVSPGDDINRVRAGAEVRWSIRRWLSVGATYRFERVGSPFANSDYQIHTVELSLGVGL